MIKSKRLIKFLAFLMVVSLLIAACDRPLPSNDNDNPTPTVQGYPAAGQTNENSAGEQTGETQPEASGEGETPSETGGEVPTAEGQTGEAPAGEATSGEGQTPSETSGETPASEAPAEGETQTSGEEATATPEVITEGEGQAEATPTAEGVAEAPAETGEPTAAEPTAETPAETAPEAAPEGEQAAAPEGAQALPATHTVAAGENLYRIGLQYGISWVSIARYNDISNPDRIYTGQVLQIPGGDSQSSGGQPEPVPTPMGINYTVEPGDTLFSIGQHFGIGWMEIAEANGLVNPNQIYAGQTLKIPVDAPTPPPVVYHQVQPGETLFLISLQYGVPWLVIADFNHIDPPYIIYTGQTLVIPGGH